MIVKILESADWHFGANTVLTLKLYNHLKNGFVKYAKEKQPDIIAICGDLFHAKLSLTSQESHYANQIIHNLINACPNSRIILVNGTRSHDLNQLELFKPLENDNFKIYMTVDEDYYKKDFKYLVIPEEYYPDKSVYDKYLNTKEKYDWVFFHGMFSFAGSYALKQGCKYNKICFTVNDFKDCVNGRVVGGHIHDPLSEGIVEYCGSFERWKHGEEIPKGFRYHEYDTKLKKVLVDEFVLNEEVETYVTKSFEEFNCDNLEELVKEISEKSKGLTSMRIKIGKGCEVSQSQVENLMAACLQFSNVVLYKEAKVSSKRDTEEEAKEAEERKKRISEYEGLTFNQITQKYCRENFGKEITDAQIAEVLE